MEIKYVIYEHAEIDQINFEEVIETSADTLRSSIDGQKVILKFIGETPSVLEGKTQYSHNEILRIINDPANGWITND
tara:strand:+ start:2934 stop:3164 length:231 start_codon:yes stop_codon:yes gene_type:complete